MPELKGLRCPACGAPVARYQGAPEVQCSYCGSGIRIEEKKNHEPEILVITPKRNILDFILIILGILWILLVVAVVISGKLCNNAAELFACILICSPGVILLLIGFRRKKATIFRDGKKQ